MTRLEKDYKNLLADNVTLKAKLDKAMSLLKEGTVAMKSLRMYGQRYLDQRNRLYFAIRTHSQRLQHPTRVDRAMYSEVKDVAAEVERQEVRCLIICRAGVESATCTGQCVGDDRAAHDDHGGAQHAGE